MEIDEKDRKVLKVLRSIKEEEKNMTTTDITKEIFEIDGINDLRSKDSMVRRKLEKLNKMGLVKKAEIDSNGRKVNAYSSNDEAFIIGSGEITVKPVYSDKKYKFDVGNVLFVKKEDGFDFGGEIETS